MTEIQEVYNEDTVGRRYHIPIVSKTKNEVTKPVESEVVEMNMNEPMDKEKFRQLSDSLKIAYITNLKKQYGVSGVQISEMLGYNSCHFSKSVVSRLGMKNMFRSRKRQNAKQASEWNKFLKKKVTETKPVIKKETPATSMFCNCSFTLKGELHVSEIADKIRAMVSDGTKCSISVSISSTEERQEA